MDIVNLTMAEINRKIMEKRISVPEVVKETMKQIARVETEINSYITVNEERIYERANQVQRLIEQKRITGSLAGVPIAVKDNIHIKGMKTTCGSRALDDFTASYDADVIEKLEAAGAVIIGKTNMDEFAMGGTTETSAFGVTKNPWNLKCVPGGSSGGSCAAVAAKECYGALGSDTGGSIRLPSAFCGVVGIKPTYGLISNHGLVPYAKMLDTIGPIARTVRDCVEILGVIVGVNNTSYREICKEDFLYNIKGMRMGVPRNYFTQDVDKEVECKIREILYLLENHGAVIEEFEMSHTEKIVPAYYDITSAEIKKNLNEICKINKLDKVNKIGRRVKEKIHLDERALSCAQEDTQYKEALCIKEEIKNQFKEMFFKYDVIVGPTTPHTAYMLGEKELDCRKMNLSDLYIVTTNLAEVPAISIPIGFDKNNLPIGMQITSGKFQEKKMIQAAYAIEKMF